MKKNEFLDKSFKIKEFIFKLKKNQQIFKFIYYFFFIKEE
jgi:hypothetical protein